MPDVGGTVTVSNDHWLAVRDLDGDGRPEFVSRDDRFELFTKAAVPLQVWSYRRGRLRDVTRRYPGRIRGDAARTWRLYLLQQRRFGRVVLPAWMADEYLLGREAAADRVLEQAAAEGRLDRCFGVGPRDPWAYVRFVEAMLRRSGYGR